MSTQTGLVFDADTLFLMLTQYTQYKNSVLLVFDLSQQSVGFNALKAYRLTEAALLGMDLSHPVEGVALMQTAIKEQKLSVGHFIEEVPIRVHRSHLVQAYLFEHIQPHLPLFNTHIFNVIDSKPVSDQAKLLNEAAEELLVETQRQEVNLRQQVKSHKKAGKAEEGALQQNNRLDFYMLAKQVDQVCSKIQSTGVAGEEMAV